MTGMKKNISTCVSLVFLTVAIASCVFGVCAGEMKTVKRKAANICMECIGIG